MSEQVEKLPLWKNVLEELEDTAAHGQIMEVEWFEERLRCKRDSMEFNLAISRIRIGLEFSGMYLSGAGLKGSQFSILMPRDNAGIMVGMQRRAVRQLYRAVTLGANTPLDSLTDSERKRHESQLERAANRLALMRLPTKALRTTASAALTDQSASPK